MEKLRKKSNTDTTVIIDPKLDWLQKRLPESPQRREVALLLSKQKGRKK